MSKRVALQPGPTSTWLEKYTPEALQHMGGQVDALLSRHSGLGMYKRAIERQLAAMAVQIHEDDVLLVPRSVFMLLEIRGSGGVSAPLEQIARTLSEVGYWKPSVHVQHYHRQDVYHLGKSAQRLFDDYTTLDKRVERLHAQLEHLKEQLHMGPETPPQEVCAGLAMAVDGAQAQAEVDAVVDLLEQASHTGWFRWLFVHLRSMR